MAILVDDLGRLLPRSASVKLTAVQRYGTTRAVLVKNVMHHEIFRFFLRATAYAVSAHMLSQFRPSVCLPSVRLSVRHTGGSVKNG